MPASVAAAEPADGPTAPLIERRWLALIGLAAVFAIPASIVTLVYVGGVNALIHLVWDEAFAASGIPREALLIGIPTVGGLLVGLCVRYLPGNGGPEPAGGHGLGGDDHEPLRYLPGVVAASVISLVAGASLGPEAPLVTIIGGLAVALATRIKVPTSVGRVLSISGLSALTAGIFGSPLASALLLAEVSPVSGTELYRRIIPALIAGVVGFYVFALTVGPPIVPIFGSEPEPLAAIHLVAAVGLGLVGALVGVGFTAVFHRLREASRPLDGRPVLKATLGGLAIGLVALTFGELTLFSGEHQLDDVVASAPTLGVTGLALVLVGKVIATLASLSTGFRGGRIFPVMFMGGVLGLVVSSIVPGIPPSIGTACGMAGTGVAILRIPLFLAILTAVFTSYELLPLIIIAAVTGYVVSAGRPEL